MPARAYTLDRVLLRIAAGKDYASAEYRKRFEEGVRACHELVDNCKLFRFADVIYTPTSILLCINELNNYAAKAKYMIYYDNTGFEYKSILSRVTLGEKISAEKYTLYVRYITLSPILFFQISKKRK